MIGKHHGKNAVIVLSLLSAGFLAAYIRYRPYIGDESTFTDGARQYESTATDRIRYAVWDAPAPLAEDVNTPEHETHPTVSPDGRFLVFSAGRPGLNADLFVADLAGGEPRDARPLSLLNSDFDEVAPQFSNDALWFASSRPGSEGGLDLFVASYRDGLFGEAAPVGRGVCGKSDDTDPAPVPGTSAVVFASNRPKGARVDFDLYLAVVPADGPAMVSRIDALDSPYDERDPAVTADGLALAFASNRDGGAGGFDLYRAVQEKGEWLAPEPIPGLNTDASERGPRPSLDGFTMWLSIEDAPAPAPAATASATPAPGADLFRARSLELYRVPGRPVGWIEILILVILLALALVAVLAKRWENLEVIYRCLLVSLVLHLLLLLWFREVAVEPQAVTLPESSRAFRVKLAPGTPSQRPSTRERGGSLDSAEPTTRGDESAPRFETELEAPAPASAASARSVEAGAPAAESVPERAAHETAPAAEPAEAAVALRDAAAPAEKLGADAPSLAMAARSVKGERVERAASAAPARSEEAGRSAPAGPAAPSSARSLSRVGRASTEEASAGERAPFAATPTSVPGGAAADVPVAAPSETFVARNEGAPELAVGVRAVPVAPDERRGAGSPERAASPSAIARAGGGGSAIDSAPARPLAGRAPADAEALGAAPVGGGVDRDRLAPAASGGGAGVALNDAGGAPERIALDGGSEAGDATAFLPVARVESRGEARLEAGAGPARVGAASGTPAGTARAAAAPGARALDAMERAEDVGSAAGAGLAAAPRSSGSSPTPREVRGPATLADASDSASSARTAAATPASEGGAEMGESSSLALAAPKRFEPTSGSGTSSGGPAPSRWAGAGAVVALDAPASGPAFRPMSSPVAAAEPGGPAPERSRIEATPYKTRFGPEKERALEEHGGGVETEKAVEAGLAYLAKMQNQHGYWGSEEDFDEKYGHASIGKSGLALLAFLGAGHTSQSNTRYSAVVEKAIKFFLDVQDKKTGHFGFSEAYSHGVATYALAECYAITKDERLRPALERAIAEILRNQISGEDKRRAGGWGYYYPDGRTFDQWPRASITSWQVMALESARLGGLEVPDAAFDGARRFLIGSLDPRYGYFRYSHDPSRLNSGYRTLPGSTPASLFALALLGEDLSDERFERALDFVSQRAPDGYRFAGDDAFVQDATGNIYFWYYATLALFRLEGPRWEKWNEAMKATLLPSQDADGSWRPIELYAQYAGDSNRNRSYTTAMNVLTLEVYYRYFTPLLKVK